MALHCGSDCDCPEARGCVGDSDCDVAGHCDFDWGRATSAFSSSDGRAETSSEGSERGRSGSESGGSGNERGSGSAREICDVCEEDCDCRGRGSGVDPASSLCPDCYCGFDWQESDYVYTDTTTDRDTTETERSVEHGGKPSPQSRGGLYCPSTDFRLSKRHSRALHANQPTPRERQKERQQKCKSERQHELCTVIACGGEVEWRWG